MLGRCERADLIEVCGLIPDGAPQQTVSMRQASGHHVQDGPQHGCSDSPAEPPGLPGLPAGPAGDIGSAALESEPNWGISEPNWGISGTFTSPTRRPSQGYGQAAPDSTPSTMGFRTTTGRGAVKDPRGSRGRLP